MVNSSDHLYLCIQLVTKRRAPKSRVEALGSSKFHHDALSTGMLRLCGGSVGSVASFMVANDGALVGFMASMLADFFVLRGEDDDTVLPQDCEKARDVGSWRQQRILCTTVSVPTGEKVVSLPGFLARAPACNAATTVFGPERATDVWWLLQLSAQKRPEAIGRLARPRHFDETWTPCVTFSDRSETVGRF